MTNGNNDSTAISIIDISKRFGSIVALDNISLQIGKGELFGLLGPNGAGKTTLISILSTILPATSGKASICGFDIASRQHKVRKSIGIVFQDPSLDDELTGEENLDFHGRLYGMKTPLRKKRTQEVLELVDLQDRSRDMIKTYSGGMRRRLEIARGLMHMPQVLFLDEPTLGLDPQTRLKIWAYILDLKTAYGMTIILTTHYMDEADRLCTRIAIIDGGKIAALGTPAALKERLGGDVVELSVANADEGFLMSLRDENEVAGVTLTDHNISLTVHNGEAFVPRVFDIARTTNVEITSVSVRKPNLEDVFIKLTGREIRDEPIPEPKERVRIYMRGKRK